METFRIVRIDGIFAHEIRGIKRLFIKITEVHPTVNRDPILDLPLYRLNDSADEIKIVGLPSVCPKRLYIIPVTIDSRGVTGLASSTDAENFLFVDWPISFL